VLCLAHGIIYGSRRIKFQWSNVTFLLIPRKYVG
jgi:hypothetical protein